MVKREIKDYICRPFCSFYREGAKEELICGGAQEVGNLMERGVLRVDELPGEKKYFASSALRDGGLETTICRNCAFREEDCDFQAEKSPPDAEPCGGYILLFQLIENGVISIDELKGSNDA
jgi:hypothetical protein